MIKQESISCLKKQKRKIKREKIQTIRKRDDSVENLLSKIQSPLDIRNASIPELTKLADEIRHFLLENVSKTGGHLASNLGVVELTLAIHHVFESPKDRIIWDVGHQSYVHKIITGRKDVFHTLRQYQGLSGFPKRNESEHDIFDTGHSSTSISAGLGIAKARDLKKENYSVISVIGDGALTGGMALEALNHAGQCNTDFIVILNDNEMSISENVGGFSKYLNRLRTAPMYFKVKDDIENLLNKIPRVGKTVCRTAGKAKDSLKYFLLPSIFFEELGFTYLGPIDGHDIKQLKTVLLQAKSIKGPVFIHVKTKKGKGYKYAENNPHKFHGIGPFDVATGKPLQSKKSKPSYSQVFGNTLMEIAEKDERVVAITAAMPDGTGLTDFAIHYPDRFFDVGIAEQHAVTFAAGLAVNGLKPVFPVYSTFLQRAYDQIVHDVCLQNLPVVFCIDRAGLVGNDGETHHGLFDISFLSHIPNMTIMAPKDGKELVEMLKYAIAYDYGPVAIRYPKGQIDDFSEVSTDYRIDDKKAEILLEGKEVLLIAIGKMVKFAYEVAKKLKDFQIDAAVINARFIKPLDEETILSRCLHAKHIITLEDHAVKGGFGSQVLELLHKNKIAHKNLTILGLPDKFIEHGSNEELFKQYGLNTESIVKRIQQLVRE